MPLKSRYVRTYRRFININHKVENSQQVRKDRTMLDFIKINHDDKVAVALHPLTKGTILNRSAASFSMLSR